MAGLSLFAGSGISWSAKDFLSRCTYSKVLKLRHEGAEEGNIAPLFSHRLTASALFLCEHAPHSPHLIPCQTGGRDLRCDRFTEYY